MSANESLSIKVIVLDRKLPARAVLRWRPIGEDHWHETNLTHTARAVYTGTLRPTGPTAIEYYFDVTTAAGATIVWPATAPELNRTVVVVPPH